MSKEFVAKNTHLLASINKGVEPLLNEAVPSVAVEMVYRLLLNSVDGLTLRGSIELQLGRSLNSVAANFMEGHGAADTQQVVRFLKIARGSAYEAIVHADCLGQMSMETRELANKVDAYLRNYLTSLFNSEEPDKVK